MPTKREKLLTRPRRTKDVTLATGDVVEVRPLSITKRTRLVKDCTVDGEVDTEKLIPALVIACTYESADATEPMFSIGDRDELAEMDADAIDPLWNAAAELNGLAADAGKDAEKN